MVVMPDLGSGAARCGSSSLPGGTMPRTGHDGLMTNSFGWKPYLLDCDGSKWYFYGGVTQRRDGITVKDQTLLPGGSTGKSGYDDPMSNTTMDPNVVFSRGRVVSWYDTGRWFKSTLPNKTDPWCNGSMEDSGSSDRGSSPRGSTRWEVFVGGP